MSGLTALQQDSTGTDFIAAFDFTEKPQYVEIDLTHAHLWEGCAVNAIDKVVLKFRRNGVNVRLHGINEASTTLMDKLAMHEKPGALGVKSGH